MKIKILETCAAGGTHYEAGTIADVPDAEAKKLVAFRRADLVLEKIAVNPPEEIKIAEVHIEHRDPQPARKTRSK